MMRTLFRATLMVAVLVAFQRNTGLATALSLPSRSTNNIKPKVLPLPPAGSSSSSSSSNSDIGSNKFRDVHGRNSFDTAVLATDTSTDTATSRRQALLGMTSTACAFVLWPQMASAGIDVSRLKVEQNPLDVFLGGTYYEDDDGGGDAGGTNDGRISRRKYTIVEATPLLLSKKKSLREKQLEQQQLFGGTLEDRSVVIKGESTSISSSRDDALELPATLFLCENDPKTKTNGGCISIDFSSLGGNVTTGYWDETENGIRFVDSQKVWSKQ